MKVIKPITITSAMLVSTTATETYSAWNAATAYVVGDKVLRTTTQRIYERLVAGTTATAPESDTTNWLDFGPSNKWAMFDGEVSTQTTAATSLTTVIKPGNANSIAFFGLQGALLTLTERNGLAGPTVFTASKNLDGAALLDWYDYFFMEPDQLAEAVFFDLPPYADAHITVTITGSAVGIGVLLVGNASVIGKTESGVSLDTIDYSIKQTDAFGVTTFVRRAYSRRMTAKLVLSKEEINKIQRTMSELRATPCAWIASEQSGFEPLTLYGYYSSFNTDVQSVLSSSNLTIEGLT